MKLRTLLLTTVLGTSIFSLAHAQTGYFKRISIDGSFTDWAGVPPAFVDDVDSTGAFDLREIYLANDEQFLYVRVKLAAPADYGAIHFQTVIDADADLSTGHRYLSVGSELLIEDGSPWQQKNGGFNEGAGSNLQWQAAPGGQVREFEARISRAVKDAENMNIFKPNPFKVAFNVQNSSWTSIDSATGLDGIPYEFAPKPAVATGTRSLVSITGPWRFNDSGADLGSDWLEPGYDDTQAGWSSGAAILGFGVPGGIYPIPVQTTPASGKVTYYFRAPFTWDFDSTGVALIASNYLSDGAVFYLNGAEVKRVRLPEGAITSTTPATGGPAAPGQAEVFTISPGGLIVGSNVLEVEVHQAAATGTELAFALALIASDSLPPSIDNPALPADRTVVEGESTSFDVGKVQGTEPLAYQWFKDTVMMPDATNATLTIPIVLISDRGSYHVEISNNTGTKVSSRQATLNTTGVQVAIPVEPTTSSVLSGTSVLIPTLPPPVMCRRGVFCADMIDRDPAGDVG